jgi:hypothetical protein
MIDRSVRRDGIGVVLGEAAFHERVKGRPLLPMEQQWKT